MIAVTALQMCRAVGGTLYEIPFGQVEGCSRWGMKKMSKTQHPFIKLGSGHVCFIDLCMCVLYSFVHRLA